MKILKKIIIALGLVFLVLIITFSALFYTLKHLKMKEIVEDQIERNLGIKVTIDSIESSPLLTYVIAKGITVHNPEGFQEKELAYIKSIHFLFDPINVIVYKNTEIYVCAVDLERLNIIKNKDNKVNIKELMPIKDDGSTDEEAYFYFDMLVLSVGEVNYIDYTQLPATPHKFPIGIKDATFIGLKDEDEVVKMILYKALENTPVGKLINLTIKPVFSDISDTLEGAWGTAKSGVKGAWGIVTMPFKLIFS